jgi:hypothetical protein
MWFVEALISVETGEKERYEYLTEEQSRAIHSLYSDQGVAMVRSGQMS